MYAATKCRFFAFMLILAGFLTACGATTAPTTSTSNAIAVAIATSTAPATTTVASTPNGDVQAGLAKFQTAGCTACHLNNGLAASVGPSLKGVSERRSDAYIINNIRKGRGFMHAFTTNKISDSDMTNILAYLHTLDTGLLSPGVPTAIPGTTPRPSL